ncbi:MAG: hypothetical protein RML93_12495 [Anaerolineales bacterium]|nr:hypothetical protein [Anaerolineales bacterium]MDW8448093.1 hypothetical protein [Anaerolineales bacterium]
MNRMKNCLCLRTLFLSMALIMASLTCTLSEGAETSAEATLQALAVQSTALALQATQEAVSLQATSLALQGGGESAGGTLPEPQLTVPPTLPVEETPTPFIQPGQEMDLDSLRKGAKILLFEDIAGHRVIPRYIKPALENAGYTFTDVESGQGWLKEQMVENKEWDLIIVAAEVSGKISGEYFDLIREFLDAGTGVVMEMWDIDSMSQGKIKPILDQCGVELEKDWGHPGYRELWYLIPDHPVLNEPNEVGRLRPAPTWSSDTGDLMKIKYYGNKAVGDATLVIGTDQKFKDSRAVLTTCLGGRLVLQTFATHDYAREDMEKLWQNYVFYALTNHFIQTMR